MATRIACLLVPDLPLWAELRANPELVGQPVAVVSGPGPRAEVFALSPEARAAGVRVGATVVHARAACASLVVRVASPALEEAARAALLDAALSTSPRAEIAPPGAGAYAAEGVAYVDARGVGALFRSEAGFAGALAERAQRLGLAAVVTLAGSRRVARIAARLLASRGEAGCLVVPPGGDTAFLAPLPFDLFDLDDTLAAALTRFGLARAGDLLRLPERALTTRLGAELAPLLALVRGADDEPPPAVPGERLFEEAADLETPLAHLEPLLFVLRGHCARLAERLACRGLAFGPLALELALDGGGRDARSIGLAATLDVRIALRLLALSLETQPPSAAVLRVHLATAGERVRGDQLDFFRPAGPTPAALGRTLAELIALAGAGRVGAPAIADEHRPDAYRVEPFRLPGIAHGPRAGGAQRAADERSRTRERLPRDRAWDHVRDATEASEVYAAPRPARLSDPTRPQADSRAQRAESTRSEAQPSGVRTEVSSHGLCVRALRPPLPAQVRATGGAPRHLRSALASGDVVSCAGPWRTSGRWWSEDERYAFDHYDVATSDGWVVRLRFDLLASRWEIDGVYD